MKFNTTISLLKPGGLKEITFNLFKKDWVDAFMDHYHEKKRMKELGFEHKIIEVGFQQITKYVFRNIEFVKGVFQSHFDIHVYFNDGSNLVIWIGESISIVEAAKFVLKEFSEFESLFSKARDEMISNEPEFKLIDNSPYGKKLVKS